jgi:hypothetical protein
VQRSGVIGLTPGQLQKSFGEKHRPLQLTLRGVASGEQIHCLHRSGIFCQQFLAKLLALRETLFPECASSTL